MLLGSYSSNYSPKFGIHKGNPRLPARTHGLARTCLVLRLYFTCTSCVPHVYFTCFGLFLQNSRCFNKTQDVSEWLEVDQSDFPCTQPLFSNKIQTTRTYKTLTSRYVPRYVLEYVPRNLS